jgi:hypothetical protein
VIRDEQAWRQWEAGWQRSTPADPNTNLRIFWTLLEMARTAGTWPPDDPLEGLENDIRLARRINTYVPHPDKTRENAGSTGHPG